MVSTRAKGRKAELKAKAELEANGWQVHLVPMSRQFQKSQDIFGIFDLFCVKRGHYKLIQIKSSNPSKLGKVAYASFWEENQADSLSVELWVWWEKEWIKTIWYRHDKPYLR